MRNNFVIFAFTTRAVSFLSSSSLPNISGPLHFEISDIFPKVSNYYFLYGTIYSIINTDSSLISIVIIQLITGIFGGVVMGYFLASLAMLGKVFHNAGKTLCLLLSIRHLQCKGCGMSFDATKEKHCPGCGTEYDLTTEDWVVTKIVRL